VEWGGGGSGFLRDKIKAVREGSTESGLEVVGKGTGDGLAGLEGASGYEHRKRDCSFEGRWSGQWRQGLRLT
jgi:hypothetical protein